MGDRPLAETVASLEKRVEAIEARLRKLAAEGGAARQADRTETAEALIQMADRLVAEVGAGSTGGRLRKILGTDAGSVEDALEEIESRLTSLSRTSRGGGFAREALVLLQQHRRHGA